jgi:hypothetical protein
LNKLFFYDGNLIPIPNYTAIDWGTGYGNFGLKAKQSQLIYFLSRLEIGPRICLINTDYDQSAINSSDVDLVIINASDHPVLNDITHNLSKPCIILGHDFNSPNYHPYQLLFSSFCSASDVIDFDTKRNYRVSCINRAARITRIYTLHKLRQHVHYNEFKIHWFALSEANQPIPEKNQLIKALGPEIANEFLTYEKEYPQYQPLTEFDLCSGINDFVDSYLNIVTETHCENIGYLTEKTFKPIRAGQLFLMQGPPGTISYLRSIGFDTFDDLIDHSYDSEPNWMIRTDKMLSELDRIYNQIESFYFQTVDRRKRNQLWLRSDDLINKCLSNITLKNAT